MLLGIVVRVILSLLHRMLVSLYNRFAGLFLSCSQLDTA